MTKHLQITPSFLAANSNGEHYAMVAQAIRYLRMHYRQQPSLQELACAMQISPFHLQRVFSAFVGVSPKRFMQSLTQVLAGDLLRSHDVLTATLESGLSSPGRLHDLMLNCVAMTPGEWRAGGAGLSIAAGFADSRLGRVLVACTPRGICHLSFLDQPDAEAWHQLRAEWPNAYWLRDDACAAQIVAVAIDRIVAPTAPLHVLLRGTNFQVRVWQALLNLPVGDITTYAGLAVQLGCPQSTRAVANAVAANTLAVLIPCHRVIRSDGSISGYRWQPERKVALLARERCWAQSE